MKRIYLWILPLLVVPIVRVYADSVSLNCPKEIDGNSEFTCQLSGYTDKGVTSLDLRVITSGDVKFLGFTKDSYWIGDGDDGHIALYGDKAVYNSFNIGMIKLKNTGGSNNNISLSNISFYDNDYEMIKVDDISLNIDIKKVNNSNNNTADNSNSNSNPIDNKENKDNNTINNRDNKDNEKDNSTVKDNGKDNDNIGSEIDSQDKDDISDIEIDGYKIDFSKDIYEYTLNIGDEDSLIIEPIIDNDKITYMISGNNDLVNGSIIKIVLMEDNNTKYEYTIKIVKEEKSNYKIVFIVIIGILIVINIIRLLLNRRKNYERNS